MPHFTQSPSYNIVEPLCETARANPELLALGNGKREISYGEFTKHVKTLAGLLGPKLQSGRVGILGTRSIAAYTGIAAAAWAGGTYVPLSLKWPSERLIQLMGDLNLDALVVDENGARLLSDDVRAAAPDLIILADTEERVGDIPNLDDISCSPIELPVPVGPRHTAYIMFTSGTTGKPKGVVVSCAAVQEYIAHAKSWCAVNCEDRIAESCDITFDVAVHGRYLAWDSGASLHLLSNLDMLAPQRFIRSNNISMWTSVPTIVNMMRKSGALKEGLFPTLKRSVFCGEPLALSTALAWANAAPNTVIDNIYGPTECTVACTRQRLDDPPTVTESRSILAIGEAFPNTDVAIFDSNLEPVPFQEIGEIALSGPQLADGYFNSPEQTADRFRQVEGKRWYLTGDLGYRDATGVLHHMGRVDNQVKVKGNRIELEEVEAHLKRASGTELVAVVAWPMSDELAEGLVGFAANPNISPKAIETMMRSELPLYMVPQRIEIVSELPVNINGKVDRNALFALLESGAFIKAPGMETPIKAQKPSISQGA